MGCLTHEQMLLEALGLERDAEASRHLRACRSCREQVEAYRSLPERLAARLSQNEQGHEAARTRLLAALRDRYPSPSAGSTADVESCPYRRTRVKEIVMRHRYALGGTVVAAAAAVLLAWAVPWSRPASAMEQTAEAIRKVKSFRHDLAIQAAVNGVMAPKGRAYWSAGRFRHETFMGDKVVSVEVRFTDQPGLLIDHRRKTYQRTRPVRGRQPSPAAMIAGLGEFSGEADEDLGSKRIGRVEAHGFRIATDKVNPDAGGGTMTVWVASDTKLPVLVEMKSAALEATMRMENFQWDAAIDPKLFDLQPPADYKDVTPPAPDVDEQLANITAALRTYAEAFDGRYPQVEMIYGDVTSAELAKKLGIPRTGTLEASRHPAFPRYYQARFGLAAMNVIQRENPDCAYFGKTVGPKDAGKVLFYWQLDGESYRVIYGDLKSEAVTEARLRPLIQKE